MLLVYLRYALIHPLDGDAEAMREVAKVLFNIHNPSLVVINRVETNVRVSSLYVPRIWHKTPLTDLNDVLIISLDSPFSFSLLLVISGLFPFVQCEEQGAKHPRRDKLTPYSTSYFGQREKLD